MIQRDLKAVIVAHQIDSKRRSLFVEGGRDRRLFNFCSEGIRGADVLICEIDSLKCEVQVEGGCRGRLMYFATKIKDLNLKIRIFADADFDRILKREIPHNVWLTDRRDLEGYFIQSACIDKVLQLAAHENTTSEQVFHELSRLGRPLALLRLMSEKGKLKLPFQKRPARPYLIKQKGIVTLEFDKYLQALLQGANISLGRVAEFKSTIAALDAETKAIPDSEMIHGKDCIAILQALLSGSNFKDNAVEVSFWISLEKPLLRGFQNFVAALNFVCGH